MQHFAFLGNISLLCCTAMLYTMHSSPSRQSLLSLAYDVDRMIVDKVALIPHYCLPDQGIEENCNFRFGPLKKSIRFVCTET